MEKTEPILHHNTMYYY